MSGRRRSLHRRLTIAQALAAALVFLVLGTALYKALEAWLVEHDHEQLRHHALLVQRLAEDCQGNGDLAAFRHRLEQLRLVSPDVQVRPGRAADSAATTPLHELSAAELEDAPIRTLLQDGVATEVLDLALHCPGRAALHLRLALPTPVRQQTLRHYRNVLLAVAAGGVLASIALSALVMRWGVRGLRRLSWEAGRITPGGRIATDPVDAELLELVQAFNATLDQLELAYRQSEAFSADVAHELRSPLTSLISGTQMMLGGPARTTAELRDALASNLEDLERLKSLVNDMLFLARADQGERAQRLERVDLGRLADTTLDYCGVLLDEAGLSASRHGDASALCNAALIRRALSNLLSNAIQYAEGERRVELHLDAQPGKVRLWVFNSGPPLSPEVSARMFDRFFRASAARADHGERHGLGLSIVQAVARMHGGSVFALAQPGGNAIGFEIPGAMATGQRRPRGAEPGPG